MRLSGSSLPGLHIRRDCLPDYLLGRLEKSPSMRTLMRIPFDPNGMGANLVFVGCGCPLELLLN